MDDPDNFTLHTAETKNVLPDVVHSQQIPTVAVVASDENIDTGQNVEQDISTTHTDDSKTESISEHIPSKCEYSTDSEDDKVQGLLTVDNEQEAVSKNSSLNLAYPHSPLSENQSTQNPSKLSISWPLDMNADVHLISEESPANLALSSDKEITYDNTPEKPNISKPEQSPRSDRYLDSLNQCDNHSGSHSDKEEINKSDNEISPEKSSGSEEIIKLDIRGQAAPKFPFSAAKIIFGPPPEGSEVIDTNVDQLPVFPNLLSPFLVGGGDTVKVEEVFDTDLVKEPSPDKLLDVTPDKSISSDKIEQSDLLIEEITVDDELKEKESEGKEESTPPKSIPVEETTSFSTLTTDYKTICEDYHVKLVHLEDAITQRDQLIEELTVSLQRSVRERDDLRHENTHLTNEVQQLQHVVGEMSITDHDTVKAQLSDFVKYQSMVKDDTKFYSALMSGGSSLRSSNSEKYMDREEITVNYSKSDLKSSDTSEDFQTGFESKITKIIDTFQECIEENLRNKLRDSLIHVLCDEIGKMRIDSDTEIKELETQIQQDKQAYTVETRRLRELLASVKSGNADIEMLREELGIKHEKEMENLRTYFEKKCSDMERSYSEEVWRGKCQSPLGSASSLDAAADAAGDYFRRRTRSAELPSLSLESTPLEQAVRQVSKKYEQQLDEMKAEHVAYVSELQARQREVIASLEDQITQLKAEVNVSLYQQDIDLELEKKMEAQLQHRLDEVREDAKRDVLSQLEHQLQVLLSDPDAEVSSWPLELVALRDRIQGDFKSREEREVSSLRDEVSACEDKWRQRRNLSFDQNRHIEEVTKERDDLKRVAVSLHRVVGQLVAYCACAEDELNRTVLAHLLARLVPADADESILEEGSRPSSPNLSGDLNVSAVSRSGKHVHFAPDLNAILSDLDEECMVGFLQQQRDLSADIKRELEHSLRRLRHEAHSLLDLSAKLAIRKPEQKMLESSVCVTELEQDLEAKQKSCDNCELHKKTMEEAMAECLQRENLLRADLEAALIKIAQLMTSADVIAEGYGTGAQVRSLPGSRPARRSLESPRSDAGDAHGHAHEHALEHAHEHAHVHAHEHAHAHAHHAELDALQRERDDLHQQLEAANRQLRSTRQFVEEQAAEREAERDEYARALADLKHDNARLAARLHNNARILNEMHCLRLAKCNCRKHNAHVDQLETQTREMNQIINELETRKVQADDELKASEEKITLLRDIISNLEGQLEQKASKEKEILQELEEMRRTIDERDGKMRSLLAELESLRSERADQSEVVCSKCGLEEERYGDLLQKVKEQCRWLEEALHHRTRKLERLHEVCSTSCSEPSEDVSLRDQKNMHLDCKSEESVSPRGGGGGGGELRVVWEALCAHGRAEAALLKRVADLEMQRNSLKDLAQEVRAERDVLQARMSEQALKISSLSARLQQQRNDAEALSHQATSHLTVQLHDALAEVQRLKEDLESKDKQLARLRQNADERDRLQEQHHSLYGNSCNPKDKVIILERELSSAQTRIAQLESLARSLEKDKEDLHTSVRDHQRALAEKEEQLQELLALKLDEDNYKDENDVVEGKTSARTLSDIVSISEFDEQDLQMRRAEIKAQNVSLTDAPYPTELRDKALNRTLPPEMQRPNMSSLNIECTDHFELPNYTPRADSLPAHLTSTQNKDIEKMYKRNVNEVTIFGAATGLGEVLSTAQKITDNCSMYPNRDVDDTKNVSVEPKKINFSLEATSDKEEFTSLRELGITLDIKQENFPDILTQLKHEIKKSRNELDICKSELKNAEEQLCEFPALKEEVEELKGLLENTMATMENDKKFYENQLENFVSNKKLLEQRVSELTQEVNEGSKNLHLLKEDILRRENMILELAKEKRNLTNSIAELEVRIDELQSRNAALEKFETENHQMREKMIELQKLEHLVSEKNQQIDSLNQHLDRLDDLQRRLHDKTEELNNLTQTVHDKTNEIFHLQSSVESLKTKVEKLNEDNDKLNINNKELKIQLTKLEKEQENASLKLQNSESELERVNSLNEEMNSKIQELKLLTDQLKDKETEIEILNEDINAFHEEIASLKEQLKMASRSPSPKKSGDEKKLDRQASSDKRQLVKIRKQISLLQHELDFNKKELNDKAFELAKAKLDVTELKNTLSQATKQSVDKDAANVELRQQIESLHREISELTEEKQRLEEQLEIVTARLREECNVSELRAKLRQKSERCEDLENELQDMKELVERLEVCEGAGVAGVEVCGARGGRGGRGAARSPTAELERAVRDQLHYSHQLDDTLVDQILSASSDEHEDMNIPPLALNTSKSSSSIHSTSSDRINRLKIENDKLQMQVDNLESRLKDKDALITELNRVREKLSTESQSNRLRYEAERDSAGRLRLLLHAHKETADTLQNQDSNMIQILKRRLESAMQSEAELQQQTQAQRARLAVLEHQLAAPQQHAQHAHQHAQIESMERLKGEVSVLKCKLEVERARGADLQGSLDHARLLAQRGLDARADACNALRAELADVKRQKHDISVELLRAKELLSTQSATIAELEKKLTSTSSRQKPIDDALTEIQSHKTELAREIATLKRCLTDTASPELHTLRIEKQQLTAKIEKLEAELQSKSPDEKEQAIRYLHGKCLRLESYRKALVWQKRYLQRVVDGYTQLEKKLSLPQSTAPPRSRGKNRFRCVARAVVAALRARFLVRRRGHVRALSAAALLPHHTSRPAQGLQTPAPSVAGGAARYSLRRDLALATPTSHMEFIRRSPFPPSSPRDDPFILSHSSPRGVGAGGAGGAGVSGGAYLSKLELVGRCLQRALHDPQVP